MSEKKRNAALNQLLADSYALYIKAQNAHWNIVAPDFMELHKLFEEIYEDLAEAIDEIAERIRTFDIFVEGSFSAFSQATTIKELSGSASRTDLLRDICEAHTQIIDSLNELAQYAEKVSDHGTMDLAGRRLAVHQKYLWILNSSRSAQ